MATPRDGQEVIEGVQDRFGCAFLINQALTLCPLDLSLNRILVKASKKRREVWSEVHSVKRVLGTRIARWSDKAK